MCSYSTCNLRSIFRESNRESCGPGRCFHLNHHPNQLGSQPSLLGTGDQSLILRAVFFGGWGGNISLTLSVSVSILFHHHQSPLPTSNSVFRELSKPNKQQAAMEGTVSINHHKHPSGFKYVGEKIFTPKKLGEDELIAAKTLPENNSKNTSK